MDPLTYTSHQSLFAALSPDRPVLIAGATASGKSALALRIAQETGGVIINTDASQVYSCWRILTARPSVAEEARAPHRLYGHVDETAAYSAGHWLRDAAPVLQQEPRAIFVGGTGLYFNALTQGLAEIPATPKEVRDKADRLSLDQLRDDIDSKTASRIDLANRARVQRAWEVQKATGRGLAAWQAATGAPLLPAARADCILCDAPKDWLNPRIERRFDQMLDQGALDEVAALVERYNPGLPAHRAIGAAELVAHLRGEISLNEARLRATIATRQFAKRQRTWFRRRMHGWMSVIPPMAG
ncbi:MAG: tRNA (adenosine(37)-N6)-dimethylallyltransferase MiaA [Pseudomonadota bacterium]